MEDRDATVVALHGEVDLASAPDFDAVLETAIARGLPVVVDLCGVDFIDSTGLSVVLRGRTRAEEDGIGLAVSCVPESSAARLFDLVGLTDVLALHGDREQALASLLTPA